MPTVKSTPVSAPRSIEVAVEFVRSQDWPFEQEEEDHFHFWIETEQTELTLDFLWMSDYDVLHFSCGYELKVPPHRAAAVRELTALINEHSWLGHFDFFADDQLLLFRFGLPLPFDILVTQEQCMALVSAGVNQCTLFHQAFQFVVYGGKSARDAFDCALVVTQGSA